MYNELPLIEAAYKVLLDQKMPIDLYELFDKVSEGRKFSKDQKVEELSSFYNDLTISAKFVYTGTNTWNLKANEKIELWEKDGSFYKEYTVVVIPDEYKEKPRVINPKIEAAPISAVLKEEPDAVVAKPKKADVEVVEEVIEESVKVVEVVEEVVALEPTVEVPVAATEDDDTEVFEEEVFEEYEDFDEDKYNEYMDTYEDKYDK